MRTSIITSLIFSMVLMPVGTASARAERQQSQVRMHNVELSASGAVNGQLLDENGRPRAGKEIEIRTSAGAAKLITDSKGMFSVKSTAGGNCAMIVDGQAYACRLWVHQTAPPQALTSFNIVHSTDPVVRGQYDDCGEGCDDGYGGRTGRVGGISGGQLLGLGLLAGAVVAIVLVANNDDDDASN